MSLFRSQEMDFYNLIIPRESAWDVMNTLGHYDNIHFIDHDPGLPQLNRPFSNYIKRCDDLLQKIGGIMEEMHNYKAKITYCRDVKELLKTRAHSHKLLEELENEINQAAQNLNNQQRALTTLMERKNFQLEHIEVLQKAASMLMSQRQQNQEQIQSFSDHLQARDRESSIQIQQIVGVISKEDEMRFKRIVFRITKGNVLVDMVDMDQPLICPNKQTIQKCVFTILHMTGESTQQKLIKVIESFQASRYELPAGIKETQQKITELTAQLEETNRLIELTIYEIDQQMNNHASLVDGCSKIENIRIFVEKEKYLYQHLNLFKHQGSVFHAELWLPNIIVQALRNINGNEKQLPSGQLQAAQTNMKPPTYFNLNSFTNGFQEIVNTYGIPRYREINPGLSTIITFPFLFGVMFGDMGHGYAYSYIKSFLLFACAFYLCTKDAETSMFKALIPIRYMLMLMGFFACYNGFIYNDFLSLGLNLFGSCYQLNDGEFERKEDCAYKFGIDPVWQASNSHLSFMNSYKMKLAVIIGVIHMLFGICLKGLNSIHFQNYTDFYFEFIPQLLLLICSFGYMDFLIIVKWMTPFESDAAPSVITTMIDMVLRPFSLPEKPMYGDGELQRSIQVILLIVIAICVPSMLFPKPLIVNAANNISSPRNSEVEINQGIVIQQIINEKQEEPLVKEHNEGSPLRSQHSKALESPHNQHEEFGDLFVHQGMRLSIEAIETIEFVLGSVSNTASYLRLWALSLAHSQLAEVFFDMTLAHHVSQGGILGFSGAIFKFPLFALCTFGVLMCMDLMECFLHALRLQWVEFQNKFYKADGYLFQSYSFKKISSIPSEDEN